MQRHQEMRCERKLTFEEYKKCCKTGEKQYRSQLAFRSRKHVMYTQKINKIALSKDDDKRLQDVDGINSYAHGTGVGIVCKSELLKVAWNLKRAHKWCF